MSMVEILKPYREYEERLREIFAQHPDDAVVKDPYCNAIPIFNGHEANIKVRARDIASEPESERLKYIMPLSEAERRVEGGPAIVRKFETLPRELQRIYRVFAV